MSLRKIFYRVWLMLAMIAASDSPVFSQHLKVEVLDFQQLEPLLYRKTDTTYLINFWATWCRPCVAELPFLEKISAAYADVPLKVVLVSLDFKSQLNSKLIPFIKKNKIHSQVVLLNAPNANAWVEKISPDWSGAIPVTLIYDRKHRALHEKEFENMAELINFVTLFNKK